MLKRSSGVLMHVTSLPGRFGIGSFGPAAYRFVDFLEETGQTYWQILPLTTTSYGDSPYQSFSAIAGNTHLIDLELLVEEGLLTEADFEGISFGDNPEFVDYAQVFHVRRPLLEKAVTAFLQRPDLQADFEAFKEEAASWLPDFAAFMAVKEHFGNKALQEWDDAAIIMRQEPQMSQLLQVLDQVVTYHTVCQYFFFKQWGNLKGYANAKGIELMGDMPIYISADSVEVWTMPDLFKVDELKRPLYVAGVPADEFSADGQYWGNPIYAWDQHQATGYAWWIARVKESLKLYDWIRIDHFKGFSDFWQIPAGESTAVNGAWESGPGYALFQAIEEALGEVPIIAENLGYIDEKAEKLLSDTQFPGMKIFQFGLFDTTGESMDLPHHYTAHSVAYTGTHDNDVVRSWYEELSPEQKIYADTYLHRSNGELITQAMLRNLYASVSHVAIATMQDILDKPGSSRMNLPNTVGQNWKWRMKEEDLTTDRKEFLKGITETYNRLRK